jgi:hypothetical protein
LSITLVSSLSGKYQISLQATARRITEETRKDAAIAIRFKGHSGAIGAIPRLLLGDLPSAFRVGDRAATT